jgi:type II secretory pathway pseudopilin PulG
MKARKSARVHCGEHGSILVVALVVIAVLAAVGGFVLESATRKYHNLHQAQAWQEAIQAAESGVDLAVASLKATISSGTNASAAWDGWLTPTDPKVTGDPVLSALASSALSTVDVVNPIPGGVQIYPELSVTQPDTAGNARLRTVVIVDSPPSLVLTNSDTRRYQYYRVRSYGTADVPGPSRASEQKADTYLRRVSLQWDRWTQQPVAAPQATRAVEAVVQPVAAFEAALLGDAMVDLNNHNILIDSYDSTVATYEDTPVKGSNGDVATNGSLVKAGDAEIHGDVATYGGITTGTSGITGEIRDDFYKELESVKEPNWATFDNSISQVTSAQVLQSSPDPNAPSRYKLDRIRLSGNSSEVLTFMSGTTTPPERRYVEIWVTGDVSIGGQATLKIPDGVNVKLYVKGDLDITGLGILNLGKDPHSLQVYGIPPGPDESTRTIKVAGNGSFYGTIYAPDHDVEIKGGGTPGSDSVYGAVVGRTVFMNGVTKFHYDESLASAGDVLGYRIVSWIEDWRNVEMERTIAKGN